MGNTSIGETERSCEFLTFRKFSEIRPQVDAAITRFKLSLFLVVSETELGSVTGCPKPTLITSQDSSIDPIEIGFEIGMNACGR